MIRINLKSGLLSSDKFISTFVPIAGSAVLHATVFAAVVGFFGWGSENAPQPEVIAIELVLAKETTQSKGVRTITDKNGSRASKKQQQKSRKPTKLAALNTHNPSDDKIDASLHPKTKNTGDNQNRIQKLKASAAPGSARQMKGVSRSSRTHGPRFAGKGLSNPRPHYPHTARSKGQQGRVILKVRVNAAGRPISVRVSKSSGVKSLDSSAMKTVKRWRFYPARKNGRAISGVVYTPITFRLVN